MNAAIRWGGLGLLVAASLAASVSIGAVDIPLGRILALLRGPAEGEWEATVLREIRLPRALVGAMVGGGLAICGTVMQGIFRNPMADPGVLGVTSGAALGAVLALYTGLADAGPWIIPLAAFTTAVASAFLVYAIATKAGRTSLATLLLAGIAVGGTAISLTSFVLSLALADYETGSRMLFWLMGGLDARSWLHVRLAAPLILGGSALICLYGRELNALATGEESALSLGVDVARVRFILILLSTTVTAAAVSVSGSILFVGLVVPHILRLLGGPDHRTLLPASFLFGAAFLTATDIVARRVTAPEELQLGVVTTLLGGPFFMALLAAKRRKGELA